MDDDDSDALTRCPLCSVALTYSGGQCQHFVANWSDNEDEMEMVDGLCFADMTLESFHTAIAPYLAAWDSVRDALIRAMVQTAAYRQWAESVDNDPTPADLRRLVTRLSLLASVRDVHEFDLDDVKISFQFVDDIESPILRAVPTAPEWFVRLARGIAEGLSEGHFGVEQTKRLLLQDLESLLRQCKGFRITDETLHMGTETFLWAESTVTAMPALSTSVNQRVSELSRYVTVFDEEPRPDHGV
jgi:hypothetical protein